MYKEEGAVPAPATTAIPITPTASTAAAPILAARAATPAAR